ncbi:MAG: hypothetical protein HY544_00310 [Candidatus Diapherotrites archaeon]|uniref:Uncharacterized protein n=1 Tax=Candidatus Iainarchaeum sp. TaxID=3101447 RepID=A0A8T3YKU8_9ARCH|nr:hypothetical protein [Candidatus Diapherotrites archaeon]
MQKVMSINKEDLDFVCLEAEEEKADRTTIIRSLIGKGRLYLAIEQYRQGKISIGGASQKAVLTISEMMDRLSEFGVEAP